MKKFSFRYQTLLEVRERRKKAEEEKLALLTAQVLGEEAQLGRLKGEEGAQREAWMNMQLEGALDLQQMVLYQEYFLRMELRQKSQQERIDEARARVLNQRDLLLEAHRELTSIEKLKERDEKVWREAIDKAENDLLDELATVRYARREGAQSGTDEPA